MLLAQYPQKGSTFEHTFTVGGVYDYYCQPHEAAGMVGRIVVAGAPSQGAPPDDASVPEAVVFPAVERILAEGRVSR